MTDFPHTHVEVDGHLHVITLVEAHAEGPRHTHRVHLGCGATIDVDRGGARHMTAATEHRVAARRAADRDAHAERAIAEDHAAASDEAAVRHQGDRDRWRTHQEPAATCSTCSAVEAGAAPVRHETGHGQATTVPADRFTGIRCPSCSGEIRQRRSNGSFACTGSGHEFSSTELLASTRSAFENLLKLTHEG